MDDFASTALYNLIAAQLRRAGLNVAASRRFEGKTDATQKADLLTHALKALGPSVVVGIGQGIRTAGADPTLAVLLDADAPDELLARWQRLERYYHGKHRVRLVSTASNAVTLEHYSTRSAQPSAGEDLVIAGLLAALLQSIGCRELALAIGTPPTAFMARDRLLTVSEVPQATAVWQFSWRCFRKRRHELCVPERAGSVSEALRVLLGSDLGRNWRVSDAAGMFGMSRRSLQRSLAREGASFQQLLRIVRAERSAELIGAGGCKLAEAGYACGFADQAHFSRDFKLRFNMSPSQFAELAASS